MSSCPCTFPGLNSASEASISPTAMGGIITTDFAIMKNRMAELGIKSPISLPGPVEPHYVLGSYLTFEGFGLDEKGKRHYLDATVAYLQASARHRQYLRRLGNLSSSLYSSWNTPIMCIWTSTCYLRPNLDKKETKYSRTADMYLYIPITI